RRVGNCHRPRRQRRAHALHRGLTGIVTTRYRAGLKACATVAAVALGVTAFASSPKWFTATTQADFLKGDVENLSIDSHGQLTLGPATETIYETATPFLWTLLPMPDGTLFMGSGNDGKVFKVDRDGKGSTFFDSTELEVHALAPAPNGGVYVGTSPDGKIYKVDRAGNATTFFSSDDKYIWAMVVDAKGNVYAGTGEKGVIYKIAPDGKGATFYKTSASHATALAFDRAGNLIVGTGTPGKVLRIDSEGKAFMLLDSPFQEIRALRFDDKGMLYVAAISGRGGSSSSTGNDAPVITPSEPLRAPVPSVSAEITSISIVDVGGSGSGGGGSPYDLIFNQAGQLIVGTGNKGKLYRFEGEPLKPTLVARAAAQQVTAFYKDAQNRLYYATANPGKLFRLESDRATHGTYESEVKDAQTIATWGALSWRGTTPPGTKVEISTRSGNTETPDDTWSNWSASSSKTEGVPI